MRIAVDARPLAQPTTGIGRYTILLLARLADDHALYLYGVPDQASLPFPVAARRAITGRGQVVSTFQSQLQFGRWAQLDRADVFFSPRHHLPRRLGRVPAVVTVHDLVWRESADSMHAGRRLTEAMLMPSALRRAARIIAVSTATAEAIARHYPAVEARVCVIPEAATLSPNATGSFVARSPQVPYMLFVGTFEPRKNLARVLDAYEALRARGVTSHRLVIAGNPGWKDAALQTRIAEPSAGVEVRGFVDDEVLGSLYAGADFVVTPSIYEGFGLVVADALIFGKPVITSNVSSMPEVAGDAAILVDPLDVNELVRAMTALISDRELHARLCNKARQRSSTYSWDATAAQTLGVLQEAAAR